MAKPTVGRTTHYISWLNPQSEGQLIIYHGLIHSRKDNSLYIMAKPTVGRTTHYISWLNPQSEGQLIIYHG